MKPKIVAFVGRAGSGKDYQCSLLEKQGYLKLSFAESLREMTRELLGYDSSYFNLYYTDLKEVEVVNGLTLRNIMENLGSLMREEDTNFWVTKLLKKIFLREIAQNTCISDLRYGNEYLGLYKHAKNNGFDFVCKFCDYHSYRYQETNEHESAGLANYLCDEKRLKDQDEVSIEMINEYLKDYYPRNMREKAVDTMKIRYSESISPFVCSEI